MLLAMAPLAAQAETLRLGVNNWLFWRAHDNGVFSGADVEVWREVARRNQLEIEYTFTPNTEAAAKLLREGAIDAFVSLLKNPVREEYAHFIEPPMRTKLEYLTFVPAGSKLTIERLEDMRGRTVALASPAAYAAFDNDEAIKKDPTPSWDGKTAVDKLLSGRAGVLHMGRWEAIWFFKNHPEYRAKLQQTGYVHREYHPCYLVMSKQSAMAAKWKERIGRTVQEMLDDGTIKRIIESYVPGWWEYYKPE